MFKYKVYDVKKERAKKCTMIGVGEGEGVGASVIHLFNFWAQHLHHRASSGIFPLMLNTLLFKHKQLPTDAHIFTSTLNTSASAFKLSANNLKREQKGRGKWILKPKPMFHLQFYSLREE